MTRIRVGIVGCGEAAQIMHLPSLEFLADRFQVTALCDVSKTVLDGVGERWGIGARYLDHRALLAEAGVDAILVATPDAFHAETCLAALAAGKHVLVEKPLCLTLREADAIEAARRARGLVVQVGYMRRYAPAFLEAVELVRGLGPVRFARVHNVLGLNELVVEPTSRVIRADDLGAPALAEARERRDRLVAEAIGPAPREIRDAYLLLLSLASHDVSALRELLGRPASVLYAAAKHESWIVSGAFDYGSFACHLVAGFDRIPRVDSAIEVYGESAVVRVRFQTSFVRNVPPRVSVTEASSGGVERRVRARWGDPFVEEWRAFHASVVEGRPAKTSPADFRHDLELFAEMVRLMR